MHKEFVLDAKGRARQAGTVDSPTQLVQDVKTLCEGSLYHFGRQVLGLTRMTPSLHLPVCQWLTGGAQKRKLLLMPRDHLKTSIVRAMCAHMVIQPIDGLYFPEMVGRDTRILLANETATNSEHQLRWLMQQWEGNKWLKALWPEVVWENPRRQSKKWNEKEMLLPRKAYFPEATIETIGVGGAVTGRHYNVMMKDDLVTFEAANSQTVMKKAIDWHKASRALFDHPTESWEVLIGTRWAAFDLYRDIQDNDPSVAVITRAAVEEGEPIFPEMFSLEAIDQLRRELGSLFFLLYMNDDRDPSLVDFDMEKVRGCKVSGGQVWFAEGAEDDLLLAALSAQKTFRERSERNERGGRIQGSRARTTADLWEYRRGFGTGPLRRLVG